MVSAITEVAFSHARRKRITTEDTEEHRGVEELTPDS
jgi:hypothetical protein